MGVAAPPDVVGAGLPARLRQVRPAPAAFNCLLLVLNCLLLLVLPYLFMVLRVSRPASDRSDLPPPLSRSPDASPPHRSLPPSPRLPLPSRSLSLARTLARFPSPAPSALARSASLSMRLSRSPSFPPRAKGGYANEGMGTGGGGGTEQGSIFRSPFPPLGGGGEYADEGGGGGTGGEPKQGQLLAEGVDPGPPVVHLRGVCSSETE